MSGKKEKRKKKRQIEAKQRKNRKINDAPVTDSPGLDHLAPPWREFYRQVIKQVKEK